MTATIDKDVKTLQSLGFAMIGFLLLLIAALIWMTVQIVICNWPLGQALPTLLLAIVLWGAAMFAASWAERIKREHDLVTYREVVDFWEGREPDRDTEKSRRERAIPGWMRIVRSVGLTLLAAAVGFLCAYYGIPLLQGLLG